MSVVPELFDGCNLKCSLCWNRHRTPSFRGMELHIIGSILNLFEGSLFEWFNWGDPILHKDFTVVAEMVKETYSAVSSPFTITLNKDYFEAIRKFHKVYCSISGMTKETYHIYNRKGNFEKAILNIKEIAKNRKHRVIMNWQMHPLNMSQFTQAKEFAEELNIEFNPFFLNCEIEDLINGVDKMSVLEKDMLKKDFNLSVKSCKLIKSNIPIDVDGNFLLCCASHNVKIGLSIYDSVSIEEIVDAKLKTDVCIKCRQKEYWRMVH